MSNSIAMDESKIKAARRGEKNNVTQAFKMSSVASKGDGQVNTDMALQEGEEEINIV